MYLSSGSRTKRYANPRLHLPTLYLNEENLSQTQMTRRRAPVMGADPATYMILYLFIVTLIEHISITLLCQTSIRSSR